MGGRNEGAERGAGRKPPEGGRAARGSSDRFVPNCRAPWSALGSRAEGEAYCESR